MGSILQKYYLDNFRGVEQRKMMDNSQNQIIIIFS
jgi:hypothetical protein